MANTKIPVELSSTPGIVDNSNATAITIDSSENVGIGGTPTNYSDHKTLSLYGNTGTGAGFIEFNDTSGNADAVIFSDDGNLFINADYDNTAAGSSIRFRVDGSSEKMRIDSSGNLLVGKTATGLGNQGAELSSTGQLKGTAPNQVVAYLNRTSSDGSIAEFRKDNSAVGSIGVVNGDRMYFTTADGLGLQFDKDNNRIVPCDAAGAYNNNVELGDENLAFTNLFLTGGIQFDSRSNKLDDYEEGTWTPTVASGTGGFNGTPEGVYVKVGNMVHVKAVFYVDVNFSGNAIGGLPFTVADDVTASVFGWNGTVVCETTGINCTASESNTIINFFNEGDSGNTHNPSTTGLLYRVSVTYKST